MGLGGVEKIHTFHFFLEGFPNRTLLSIFCIYIHLVVTFQPTSLFGLSEILGKRSIVYEEYNQKFEEYTSYQCYDNITRYMRFWAKIMFSKIMITQ